MQNSNAIQTFKIPPFIIGSNPVEGNQRTQQDGDSEGTKDDCTIFESELHLLTKSLTSLPMWQIKMIIGSDDTDFINHLKIIDTEEKQLQCISDLWDIIKVQPKYKKLKEPDLKVSTEPKQVLQYLLKKIGALAGGLDWHIDSYMEGKKMRYCFVIKKFYPTYEVRHNRKFLPLDFLPALEKKDKQLHDLIIEVVAMVSKHAKVPLWDEDGDYSEAKNYLLHYQEEFSTRAVVTTNSTYSFGIANEYLLKIKERRLHADRHTVNALWEGYNAKSLRKQQMRSWFNLGVELSEMNDCINNHSYIPNFDTDKGIITPYRNYKIIWSSHKADLINVKAKKDWEADKRKSGQYYPLSFSITKPGEIIKPNELSKFPGKLDEFFVIGKYYFTGKYESYYYKNTLNEHYSPWEL